MFKRGIENLRFQKRFTSTGNFLSYSHPSFAFLGNILDIMREDAGQSKTKWTTYKRSLKVLTSEVDKLCRDAKVSFRQENNMRKAEEMLLQAVSIVRGIDMPKIFSSLDEEERQVFSKPYAQYAEFLYKTKGSEKLNEIDELLEKALEINANDGLAESIKIDAEYSYPRTRRI